jgi:peroxiredoxin
MALKLLDILVRMEKKFSLLIAILLLFGSPAYSADSGLFSKIGIQSVRDKQKAPDFCLDGLNGEKVRLNALKGKILFLNFWASWCGPCKEEMPSMEALHQHYKERDFVFLTISVDYEGPEAVRKFIDKHRYRFPVLLDPKGKTLDLFEISEIPATVIIDKKRKMIGRVIGPRNWTHPDVFSLIDQMLDDRPSRVVSSKD